MNSRMYNKHQLEYLEQVNEGILGTALKGAALAGGAYMGYKGLQKLGSGSITGALGKGNWADKAKNLGTKLAASGARREKGGQGASGALMKGAGIALGRLGKTWAKSKSGGVGGAVSNVVKKASSGSTAKPTPVAKPKQKPIRDISGRSPEEQARRNLAAKVAIDARAVIRNPMSRTTSSGKTLKKIDTLADKSMPQVGRVLRRAGQTMRQQNQRVANKRKQERQKEYEDRKVARKKQATVQKAAAGGAGTVAGQRKADAAAARSDKTTAGMMDYMNR